ncbi:MAG: DUF86 domain-containing protein [Deltaproteobacteria bacterium]|nr:DUF86 domain-containing protein [Deltaproteobacteria bacterium]
MQDDTRKHLMDILHAAEEIKEFTKDMDIHAYSESRVTQRAVERGFEIIGEALNRIKKIDETVLLSISEHQRIIGFRNILIHGYDIVDAKIVWDAIKNHLPLLQSEAQKILKQITLYTENV